ncbi:SPOR domain-containing protein [Vibrio sp. SCSIO 43136]|uniref:SPOR domain-containing protein n=1 Tax=Vibrio sp. SCSIO 43136 TaxID=2819101 RepID=UPI0020752E11|nr:SPOR domain-containing protein [Vibrio sp. SCSIO 43136]USD65479.1 SPOR domain-containing protein [Vibrio sp. SCSIO 43136]
MANKDYVRRGRGQKKPARRSAPKSKPWKAGLVAILLVGVFGYGLFTLSQDPEPPTPVSKPAEKKVVKKPSKPLPPPPEEEWEYMESLPNKEVKVEAKEAVVSDIPYIMQCGAFKLESQAEERKVNIAFQGISSQIRKKEGSSWYRVVLGPYTRKRDAERDKHKLQKARIEPCAIWKEAQ